MSRRNWTGSKEADLGAKIIEQKDYYAENILRELLSIISITAILKGHKWTDSGVTCGPAEVCREPEGGEEVEVEAVLISTNGIYLRRLTTSEAPELYKLAEGLRETTKMDWVEQAL